MAQRVRVKRSEIRSCAIHLKLMGYDKPAPSEERMKYYVQVSERYGWPPYSSSAAWYHAMLKEMGVQVDEYDRGYAYEVVDDE